MYSAGDIIDMNEVLKKLLDSDVLTEETKQQIEQSFNETLNEEIQKAKQQATTDVQAQLTEQWVSERDALIEAIDTKVGDMLQTELTELKQDIEKFRDLEAEYAQRIVETKGEMSEELKGDLTELVEKIDSFLEIRLSAELEELKEDIDQVKKNEFGRRIFESVVDEYVENFQDPESAHATLSEFKQKLKQANEQLEEAESERDSLKRQIKMKQVLSPLVGKPREVMEAILKTVDTDNLEEGYNTFITRVIHESDDNDNYSEKEGKVLAENDQNPFNRGITVDQQLITGDVDPIIQTNNQNVDLDEGLQNLKKLAGL